MCRLQDISERSINVSLLAKQMHGEMCILKNTPNMHNWRIANSAMSELDEWVSLIALRKYFTITIPLKMYSDRIAMAHLINIMEIKYK